MKFYINILLGLTLSSYCYAQHADKPLYVTFKSIELPNTTTGSIDVSITVHALANLTLDSIVASRLLPNFSYTISQAWNATTLLSADSATATVHITYNSNALPYYPQQLEFTAYCHTASQGYTSATVPIVVYFTPYNTTELWNMDDYWQLSREWEQPNPNMPDPQRISVPKTNIPLATRISILDSTKTQYEKDNEYTVSVVGVPYNVVMKALTPAQKLAVNEADSLAYIASNSTNKSSCVSSKKHYQGTIQGRVTFWKIPDNTIIDKFPPLSGVRILLTWRNVTDHKILDDAVIDANGMYSLDYDFEVSKFRNQGRISLRLISDDGGDFGINTFPENIFSTDKFELNNIIITSMSTSNNGTKTGVDWQLPLQSKEPFTATHYAHNAYKFVREHYTASQMPNGLNIHVYGSNNPVSSHYRTGDMFLETGDTHRESVVYHEFGHHVMNTLQGGYPITGAVATHPWSSIHTPREVWAEGWGYAFAQMCDLRYHYEDGEFDWITSIPGQGAGTKDCPGELRNPYMYKLAGSYNGFTSEYDLACAMYDLYDGADKFNTYMAASNYDDNDPTFPYKINALKTNTKSSYLNGKDNVSLSFKEIADFFIYIKNSGASIEQQTAYTFYKWLVSNYTACQVDDIAIVFRENRVVFNNTDAEYMNALMDANIITSVSPHNYTFNDYSGLPLYGNIYKVTDIIKYDNYIPSPCCTYNYYIDNTSYAANSNAPYKAYNNVIINSAQGSFSDSVKSNVKIRKFYIQTDIASPIFALITNKYWERQSQLFNSSVGFLLQNSISKKVKKSIQISVYSYSETKLLRLGFQCTQSRKYTDYFITPELKFLFNKKQYNKGFYSTLGIGGGVRKFLVNKQLQEKSTAWDALGSIGYIIRIKRFYVDFKLGGGGYFVYKTIYFNKYTGNLSEQEYLENFQKFNLEPTLRKVEFLNENTITYKYKYLGIGNAIFIPNFGVHFGFTF
jgi:hypothetical protein